MNNDKRGGIGIVLSLTALGLSIYALSRRPPRTKTGNYIGDGSTARQIKTGFRCSEVVILNNIVSATYLLLPEKTNYQSGPMTQDVTPHVYLTDDGFIVGDNSEDGNNMSVPYYWWAVSR